MRYRDFLHRLSAGRRRALLSYAIASVVLVGAFLVVDLYKLLSTGASNRSDLLRPLLHGAVLLLAVIPPLVVIPMLRVPVPGHCPKCGYSLMGLTEPRCPECGRPFTFEEVRRTPQELMFGGSSSDGIKRPSAPPDMPCVGQAADRGEGSG